MGLVQLGSWSMLGELACSCWELRHIPAVKEGRGTGGNRGLLLDSGRS